MAIQVYKKKTILVKWNGDKIVIDIPFSLVDKAMQGDIIKISEGHSIRTKAINEWYEYNITDELEAWVYDNFPTKCSKLLTMIDSRKKQGLTVNKTVISYMAEDIDN